MGFREEAEADFLTILGDVAVPLIFDGEKTVKASIGVISLEKDLQAGGFIETARYDATVRETDLEAAGIVLESGKYCEMRGKKFRIERVEAGFVAGLDRFYLTEI